MLRDTIYLLNTPLRKVVACLAFLTLTPLMYGTLKGSSRGQKDSYARGESSALSDLAKDNFDLVAASSIQIREILVRDAGLLVELKRWVAKEASDNGQVVQEGNLSEQAIFDRLDQDIKFRSVATRLLQRYGYLMPSPNPESSVAKEEDLVLKERARRLVQIEAQEDAEALQLAKHDQSENDVERNSSCDPQQDGDCERTSPRRARPTSPVRNEAPIPDNARTVLRSMASPLSAPSTLQTNVFPGESGLQSGGASELQLASKVFQSGLDTASISQARDLFGAGNPLSLSQNNLSTDRASPRDIFARTDIAKLTLPEWRRQKPAQQAEDRTPVKMVRRANPYADVPSLYDMYVQAAVSQRPAERFGLDVFRNSESQPDVIPMDLPVGPDYVVGTGDTLSIDLWGSVSQRLVRLVDREGRVSLPETGPLLVSGKNLEEIQLQVQHALRTVFREVSADVSLSRVRTIRVYVVGDVAEPGAYDISSLSTPLNALFAAGGVTDSGSLRALKHSRGKQLVQEVDAYDLLLHGVRADLKRLQDGDTLLVPPLGPQVTVEGMVRRPGVYELLEENSLTDVLALAGGILPTAALRHIEVQRVEAHEKRTMLTLDLTSDTGPEDVDKQLQAFKVRDGDQIHIFPIAAYNEDAIYLQGHVLRPGRYSYKPGMKLTDLISSYSDL